MREQYACPISSCMRLGKKMKITWSFFSSLSSNRQKIITSFFRLKPTQNLRTNASRSESNYIRVALRYFMCHSYDFRWPKFCLVLSIHFSIMCCILYVWKRSKEKETRIELGDTLGSTSNRKRPRNPNRAEPNNTLRIENQHPRLQHLLEPGKYTSNTPSTMF